MTSEVENTIDVHLVKSWRALLYFSMNLDSAKNKNTNVSFCAPHWIHRNISLFNLQMGPKQSRLILGHSLTYFCFCGILFSDWRAGTSSKKFPRGASGSRSLNDLDSVQYYFPIGWLVPLPPSFHVVHQELGHPMTYFWFCGILFSDWRARTSSNMVPRGASGSRSLNDLLL